MHYRGTQAAVLGLGRSGEAAALLLAQLGATVTVLDSAEAGTLDASRVEALREAGIQGVFGAGASEDSRDYDLAVLSPGIDPATSLVRRFIDRNIPLISEIELAYLNGSTPVIGITGTNGKTTTTELVAAMLNGAGVRTIAAGNIGKPYSEVVREAPELDVITLEVSSFQLERIETFRPAVSVWLNLTPDHLDRYSDETEYRQAKLRIFEQQTPADWAVVNARDSLPPLQAQRITFSAYQETADLHLQDEVIHYRGQPVLDPRETGLRGRHNCENLMAALGVGLARGLTPAQMAPALCDYRPQPHRYELVREVAGVTYINDSKATNLDALEKALDSEARPVILIAGGKDKGFGFESLAETVAGKARWVVLIGEMSARIAESWGAHVPCEQAVNLSQAVTIAWSLAQPGDVVLFSPGTSSFDMFTSYADRGNQFRALVNALPATPASNASTNDPAC
jgi:UDP-N-acetylmuramoylalanine--D-glutamate ligase